MVEQEISSIDQSVKLSQNSELLNCEKGEEICSWKEDLVDHEGVHTAENLEGHDNDKHTIEPIIPVVFKCDKCEHSASSTNELIGHKLQEHQDRDTYIKCNHCKFVAKDIPTMNEHIETDHIDLALLNCISLNQKKSEEGFEKFQHELSDVLNKIIDSQNVIIEGHNAIKQEMFILRQSQKNYIKLDQLDEALELLSKDRDVVVPPRVACPTLPPVPVERPPPAPVAQPPPASAQQPTSPRVAAGAPEAPVHHRVASAHSKVLQRDNTATICIIGDSITASLDNRVIERATNSTVRTARAYSSLNDTCENDARAATKFPNRGFKDVIAEELEFKPTDVLIVQAGSVDVTNLKTDSGKHNEYEEYFKQETIISAQNIFETVSAALSSHPELQKVVLMEQTPRYDTITSDPHSIKPGLSKLYNRTLEKLCHQSPLKDRLIFGKHTLVCTGGIRESRYVDHKRNRYDGIHLYGPSGGKSYTESVLSILRNSGLIKNTPPVYFRRYHSESSIYEKYVCPTQDLDWLNDKDVRKPKSSHKSQAKYDYKYNVTTSNRFEHLNW